MHCVTSRCHGAKFFCSKQFLLTEQNNGASVTQLKFLQANHVKKRKDYIKVFVTFCFRVLLELRNVNFTLRRSKRPKWFRLCFAPDCNHQSESHTWKFFGKEKKNEEYRRWIRLLRFVYFFAHKHCNSIKLKSSVCTRKASAKQFTTNRVQVSLMSIGGLFWFGNIRGLSLPLHYISLTFPNQTIIKCLQSKKVRKWIIRGLILCDDVVSQYVQSRSVKSHGFL